MIDCSGGYDKEHWEFTLSIKQTEEPGWNGFTLCFGLWRLWAGISFEWER